MNKLTDNIDKARAASRERLETAREIATESTAAARERMSESKARAKKARAKSEETISNSPLTIVASGAALGILIGMLLPKSKAEGKYVAGAGRKVNETVKTAYQAAKDASREQIAELGLSNDGLRTQFKHLLGKAVEAAKTAITAAQDAVKEDNQDKK